MTTTQRVTVCPVCREGFERWHHLVYHLSLHGLDLEQAVALATEREEVSYGNSN